MIDSAIAFVRILGSLLEWCILLQVLMSWFRPSSGNAFYGFLASIVAPIYRAIGRVLPPLAIIDLRPLVAFFLIRLATSGLVSLLSRL